MNYNEMVSAIYAGQAIERLPANGSEYTVKEIINALGCSGDPDTSQKLIYDILWDEGYRARDYGPGNQYKFTCLQAIQVIRLLALALLKDNPLELPQEDA